MRMYIFDGSNDRQGRGVSDEATEHNIKLQAMAVMPRVQERMRRTDQCLLPGGNVMIPGH